MKACILACTSLQTAHSSEASGLAKQIAKRVAQTEGCPDAVEYTTINPANAGHSSCPGWWAEHPTGGAQPVMRLTTQCTLAEDQSHASPVDD